MVENVNHVKCDFFNKENTMKAKKEPLTVTYVGFGGFSDTPCYMDEDGRYYFDENNGRNGLDLYTGAWKNEDCGEICGEPNEHVTRPVICDDPFVRSDYEFDFRMLSRLKMDCDYFLGYGNGHEGHLCHGTVEKQCDEMKKLWNALPANEKPEWLTMENIKEYRAKMLSLRKAAFVTERITNMICLRLKDYGYAYDGHMYPKLYPVYLKVAHATQDRLNIKRGFLKSGMEDQELFRMVREVLDDILPVFNNEDDPVICI